MNPPKVDYYDIFYFETRMRDMIQENMEKIRLSAKQDKEEFEKLNQDYERMQTRILELEDFCFPLVRKRQ